jgi:hypothetical protein
MGGGHCAQPGRGLRRAAPASLTSRVTFEKSERGPALSIGAQIAAPHGKRRRFLLRHGDNRDSASQTHRIARSHEDSGGLWSQFVTISTRRVAGLPRFWQEGAGMLAKAAIRLAQRQSALIGLKGTELK